MANRRHVMRDIDMLIVDEPVAPLHQFDGLVDLENLELIDETTAPVPFLDPDLSSAGGPINRQPSRSAVPRAQPMAQKKQSLGWGSGTDGWPRQNSRLVRLFLCSPGRLIDGCVGGRWGALNLASDVTVHNDSEASSSVSGFLQMPYPSPPLEVDLRAQPFERHFTRVDLVLRSKHRWPRRYFDVASCSLTTMQVFERRLS